MAFILIFTLSLGTWLIAILYNKFLATDVHCQLDRASFTYVDYKNLFKYYAITLFTMIVVGLLMNTLNIFSGQRNVSENQKMILSNFTGLADTAKFSLLVVLVFSLVVVAPICESVLTIGLGQYLGNKFSNRYIFYFFSIFVYAFMHIFNSSYSVTNIIVSTIQYGVLGYLFTRVFLITHSLWQVVLLHVLYNLTVVMMILYTVLK